MNKIAKQANRAAEILQVEGYEVRSVEHCESDWGNSSYILIAAPVVRTLKIRISDHDCGARQGAQAWMPVQPEAADEITGIVERVVERAKLEAAEYEAEKARKNTSEYKAAAKAHAAACQTLKKLYKKHGRNAQKPEIEAARKMVTEAQAAVERLA